MESNTELKNLMIKFVRATEIEIEDFDFDNVLLNEKSYEKTFWFMTFHARL